MTVVTTELARAHGVVAPPLGRGTLRLLENDDPAAPPETAITVTLTFTPIGAAVGDGHGGGSASASTSASASASASGGDPSPALVVPLADLLTLRVTPASSDSRGGVGGGGGGGGVGGVTAASLTFLRAGAVRVPAMHFFGGPAAAAAFVDALRRHAYLTPLTDEYPPAAPVGHPARPVGDLYVVDAKRRHRRAPASLLSDDGLGGGGVAPHAADGAPLLLPPPSSEAADGRTPPVGGSALPWQSPWGPAAGRPPVEVLEERLSTLGFSLLGQFARVTAAARELGEEVARTFDPAAAIAAAAAAAGGGAGGVGGGWGARRCRGGGLPAAEANAAARAAMAAAEAGESSHGAGVHGGTAAAATSRGGGGAEGAPAEGVRTATAAAAAAAEANLPPALVADEPRGVPVSAAAWAAAHDPRERRLYDPAAIRYAVYRGGVEGGEGGAGAAVSARPDVWPGLLGVWPWDASVTEREAAVEAAVERWVVASREWHRIKAAADAADVDGKEGGVARVQSGATDMGGATDMSGSDEWGGGGGGGDGDGSGLGEERDGAASPAKRRSSPSRPPPAPEHVAYHEQEHLIAKDVARSDPEVGAWSGLLGDILNVYATHNGGLGYCQGMADVLAPILVAIAPPGGPSPVAPLSPANSNGDPSDVIADSNTRTAAIVYAAFTHLMRRLSANFRIDQSGLASQLQLLRRLLALSDPTLAAHLHTSDEELHVCFRWVMLQFKRELSFADTCRLWEVSWSRPEGGERLHLYAAVGLLRAHRTKLMALPSGRFDCLLRFINDVGGRVTVDYLIGAAEKEASRLGELLRQQGGRRYEG
ncbi:hypothetical protein MMPV_004982 [Pyropia vietnamensis]